MVDMTDQLEHVWTVRANLDPEGALTYCIREYTRIKLMRNPMAESQA